MQEVGRGYDEWVKWVQGVGVLLAEGAPGTLYGKITFNFQAGKLVNVGVEESIRMP